MYVVGVQYAMQSYNQAEENKEERGTGAKIKEEFGQKDKDAA